MASNAAHYRVVPVSTNARDDELHVSFQMLGMSKTRPKVGQTLLSVFNDAKTQVETDTYGWWKLRAITSGSEAQLIFSPDLDDFDALQDDPSDSEIKTIDHPWPHIIRGQPQWYHFINNGDYGGTNLVIDDVEATTYPTDFIVETWWTTCPWPKQYRRINRPRPTTVRWGYPGCKGSRLCLHEDIQVPPLTGITSWQGRPYSNLNVPGFEFPATDQKTWTKHHYNDVEDKINGRFRRTRWTALPPWNALNYPKAPVQYTS